MTLRAFRIASWAAIAALLMTLIGFYIFDSVIGRTDRPVTAGSSIGIPFTLTDHDGNPITEQALNGQPSAVFFGFTHCPEVCPTTLYELSVWFRQLGDEGDDLQAFFITVDPQRDTPQVMKSYVENFTDRITGITGDPETVERVARAWNIYWKKVPLEGDDYTMDHTASIFLVDADGNFHGTIAYGEESETALAKLRRLANG